MTSLKWFLICAWVLVFATHGFAQKKAVPKTMHTQWEHIYGEPYKVDPFNLPKQPDSAPRIEENIEGARPPLALDPALQLRQRIEDAAVQLRRIGRTLDEFGRPVEGNTRKAAREIRESTKKFLSSMLSRRLDNEFFMPARQLIEEHPVDDVVGAMRQLHDRLDGLFSSRDPHTVDRSAYQRFFETGVLLWALADSLS